MFNPHSLHPDLYTPVPLPYPGEGRARVEFLRNLSPTRPTACPWGPALGLAGRSGAVLSLPIPLNRLALDGPNKSSRAVKVPSLIPLQNANDHSHFANIRNANSNTKYAAIAESTCARCDSRTGRQIAPYGLWSLRNSAKLNAATMTPSGRALTASPPAQSPA